jgi:hypothetical protein
MRIVDSSAAGQIGEVDLLRWRPGHRMTRLSTAGEN